MSPNDNPNPFFTTRGQAIILRNGQWADLIPQTNKPEANMEIPPTIKLPQMTFFSLHSVQMVIMKLEGHIDDECTCLY